MSNGTIGAARGRSGADPTQEGMGGDASSLTARLWRSAQRSDIPITASLEITLRCNLACTHCYNFDRERPYTSEDAARELTHDETIGIIDQLAEAGCLFLSFTGGEALLHPHLESYVRHARRRRFSVKVKTNGATLGPANVAHVSFFEGGGTSLLALRMVARLASDFGASLPIARVFEYTTRRALARFLASGDGHRDPGSTSDANRAGTTEAPPPLEPIAVVGIAGRFPGAPSVAELWRVFVDGRHTERVFTRDELDPSLDPELTSQSDYVLARGVLDDVELFDNDYFQINPREAEVIDPQQRVFLEVVVEALDAAAIDCARYPGAIGLYAGSGNTTYFSDHLRPRPEVIDRVGALAVRLGNEKDFLVTRVAHKLGLRGPAVAVNTACSTSLVAIAQAFRALRAHECDIALAGGVSITTPPNSGYLFEEGSMLSPDARCRPFDADAQGTSFNDGVGIVVLKRLSEALADGDHVHAIVRGVGLNNDGSDKMSFTAPSVDGQADAIRRAHRCAGVTASQISYVEAHGTATPIGDPIEVAALARAFAGVPNSSCALGSAKSNVGHTVSAAGVTGFIKAVLALEHELLPATVGFVRPNPQLHLEETPFWVVSKSAAWVHGERPLRAGVSSFGVGGTNAHVILEQAPARGDTSRTREVQVLPVSAKTKQALVATCRAVADHLDCDDTIEIGDVAHTLQTGRTEHPFRIAVVGRDPAGIAAALRTATTSLPARAQASVAFMFPGQGAQYTEMGLELRQHQPVFRRAFDECCDAIDAVLGESIVVAMQCGGEKLKDTRYTQPALFAIEYALARYWQSLGIRPSACIGHSVGEFVAAAICGVMHPADAARLVTLRGRLLADCPQGAMLAVRAPMEKLRPQLLEGAEIAAENSSQALVVAGPFDVIAEMEKRLTTDGTPCRALHTSHAFHSALVEPAVAPFTAEVSRIELQPPTLPFVSTVTGEWISNELAVSPEYWGKHLRHPVRFARGINCLLNDESRVLLEVGPRRSLITLARHESRAKGRHLVASLGDDSKCEILEVARALGELWAGGVSVDWSLLRDGETRRRLVLPSRPFQRKRFWIDPPPAGRRAAPVVLRPASPPTVERPPLAPPPPSDIAVTPTSRRPRLVKELLELLEELSGYGMDEATNETNFVDLGLDSLLLTQAAQAATKRFGVKLKLRHFADQYPTVGTLVDHLDGQLPAHAFVEPSAPASSQPTFVPDTASQPPAPGSSFPTSTAPQHATLQWVLDQQMDLMRRQLQLLGATSLGNSTLGGPVETPAASRIAASPGDGATGNHVEAATNPTAASVAADLDPLPPVKGHGPQLVIVKDRGNELSPTQQRHLARLVERYCKRTKKSKAFTQRNRDHVADPRVVAGFRPAIKELVYPIVAERSSGCRIWDLDGNEYIDLLNGYGSNFFGYGAAFVREAMAEQMEIGLEIGPQTHLIEEVTALFREFVPMDRVAYCNTGSEAVLAALRVARTATGKDTVVMFEGGYHGLFDEVVVRRGARGKSWPAAPGIPKGAVENLVVLDWAAPESLAYVREHADEIAAVLVEPVQSRLPSVQPVEFLTDLRDITTQGEVALIFDEVVTGFRVAPGGAQERFGIEADLATYGKVVGGGLSIGIIAGKREYMDALDGGAWQYGDDSIPQVGVTYFAGTFVRHPLSLAVSRAVLRHLKEQGPALQQRVDALAEQLTRTLASLFKAEAAPLKVECFSSVLKIATTGAGNYDDLVFNHLRERGVHAWPGRPCFFTAAHGEAELEFIVDAFRQSIFDMQKGGFYPRPVCQISNNDPPAPNARLGRDRDGNPAWFVPDPENPKKYRPLVQPG